jgi:hypothetical protein
MPATLAAGPSHCFLTSDASHGHFDMPFMAVPTVALAERGWQGDERRYAAD